LLQEKGDIGVPIFHFGILQYGIITYRKQPNQMGNVIYTEEHRYLVEQLRSARLKAKMTQIEVAKFLGKTQSYISKIEAGQRRIDIVQLKEFAKLYRKDLGYFIK